MLTFMVRSPDRHPFPILLKRLSRKHYKSKSPIIIMGHTTVVKKGSEHRICQKMIWKKEKESERKSIWDRYPTLFNKLFNSKLTRQQGPWIKEMPPEAVKQLSDADPKCSSFRFLFFFLQIRHSVLRTFCTTVVQSMVMEAFDVLFSGKSVS